MFIEEDTSDKPHAFIQYKNTDICIDFHCECGGFLHYDGYFAYAVKCPYCLKEWELPCNLMVRPNKREHGEPIMLQMDDEDIVEMFNGSS